MYKVLAADDEAYMQEALRELIRWDRLNCELLDVFGNGKELIGQMQEGAPDIVITDIRMPVEDGLEVCKYVYERCPETQVIILSAYSDFDYARAALRYSACDYVLKVSVLEELPRALKKAIENLERQGKELSGWQGDERWQDTDSLYGQMVHYVEQNYLRKITLDEIAEYLHANRSYLSRLYKSRSGVNLFDDILRRRVEKAKEYMEYTDRKLYEIAVEVGFEDAGYFSKVFQKYTGMSPKEYRNQRKDTHEKKT